MKLRHLDVDAVVFDLDGTLIDSEKAICDAGAAAFKDIGVAVTDLQIADHLGAPLEELYTLFVNDGDDARMRHFIKAYIERHDEHPDRFPPPLPGVVDALVALSTAPFALPLAVATTKPTDRARSQLEGAGLERYFAHIQGTDPGMKPKPAPDVVVKACAGLAVPCARALMVGDTPRDVAAAKAAGSFSAAVAYSEPRLAAASRFGADLVLGNLAHLLAR